MLFCCTMSLVKGCPFWWDRLYVSSSKTSAIIASADVTQDLIFLSKDWRALGSFQSLLDLISLQFPCGNHWLQILFSWSPFHHFILFFFVPSTSCPQALHWLKPLCPLPESYPVLPLFLCPSNYLNVLCNLVYALGYSPLSIPKRLCHVVSMNPGFFICKWEIPLSHRVKANIKWDNMHERAF